MTSYQDLTSCGYFGLEPAQVLSAVGWLGKSDRFTIGSTDPSMYERLAHLLRDPWQPVAGLGDHACEICQFESDHRGHRNLFVPHDHGTIFVCPELITHYIAAHWYQPPGEFCEAVMRCPEMRSMEYRRRLIECGWKSFTFDLQG